KLGARWLFCLALTSCHMPLIQKYQAESQPLHPCELQREKASSEGDDYVPQCTEDGRFRNIQCSKDSHSCWCVDAKGVEVPGSKQTRLPVACLSFCQLQKQQVLVNRYVNSSTASYVPQCRESGEFDPMQCDLGLGQCWCVDSEGMEIYGTRQTGKPLQCPGSCETRDRRILHGVGEKSPPQCSADGGFLPVQCKFVNTSDMMVFDLVNSFNRLPNAFQTFSSFRSTFPEVSGYCYCVDSLGRELEETGLELLLENVYDTVFAALEPARTFTETGIYRILQRRFLGVQLATSGRFRCPSKCEIERSAAIRFAESYSPSCEANGNYNPVQCQQEGPCWCVDSKGQEIQGTRRQGQPPICGEARTCASERRQALSRLFYGPVGHFSQRDLFSSPDKRSESQKIASFSRPCPPSFKELFVDSGLLPSVTERSETIPLLKLESLLSEAVRGMFPSRELTRAALQLTTNPKRFQENLFGGKFLKNLIQFNFTGALGARGTLNVGQYFQQIGVTENGEGFEELAKEFSLRNEKGTLNLSQIRTDRFGRTVNLQDNRNRVKFLASILELPVFFTFLRHVISVPETIADDLGEVVKIALKSKECAGWPIDLFVPACTQEGQYEGIQCYAAVCWCVDPQGREIPGSRVEGRHPRCPTACEKQRESLWRLKSSQPAGSDLFVPTCTEEGAFLPVQCHGTNCFCVDLEGRIIPGTGKKIREHMQCPSACQLIAGQAFLQTAQLLLSDPSALSQFSSVYIPQCNADGKWRQVQCNGPPELAFEWYQRWVTQSNEGKTLPVVEVMNILRGYKKQSSQSFAAFTKSLYESGHQNIFPVFSRYPSFDDLPSEVLEGNVSAASANVLLDPYTFWQLLQGQRTHYPGSYTDFSALLGHFDLRNCWCVNNKGQEVQGTKEEVNKVPACPAACNSAQQEAMRFIGEVDELVRASNGSHFPFGKSFLVAKGIALTDDELLHFAQSFPSGTTFSERLLSGNDYAIRLAAQSTLRFYWRSRFASRDSAGEATLLAFHPYVPQCDRLGNWEPIQCYKSSGEETPAELVGIGEERCPTSCDFWRSRANALFASWKRSGSEFNVTSAELFIPSCLENGEYAVLQESGTESWCVDPASGEVFQRGGLGSSPGYCSVLRSKTSLREIGKGYIPQCEPDKGTFSPVQCGQDEELCWCVFENGEEVPGTRVSREKPACESPQCSLLFNASYVATGAVFCENVSDPARSLQQCQLICRSGFHSVFPSGTFLCDRESRRWIAEPPLFQTCQKLQLFQTVRAQTHFQLLLPAGKTCSSDYSGLLQAFQVFILDELKARGFCQIQVLIFLWVFFFFKTGIRNMPWKLTHSLNALLCFIFSLEKAIVGENLIGRFEALIKGGGFLLHLDSKQFPADTSIRFPRDEDFDTSHSVQLGCRSGFQRIPASGRGTPNSQGCVICPLSSYFQNDTCIPCPPGLYQDQPGNNFCIVCPLGKTTVSAGAFRADHCITDCQRREQGLRCDEEGQYRPSQEDPATKKSFCVNSLGQRLNWTEADGQLPDSQCLADSGIFIILHATHPPLLDTCGFLTVSTVGTEVLCELYSATENNFNCTTSGLIQGALGNSAETRVSHLSCLLKVRSHDKDAATVYRKRGEEFTTSGLKTFEKTDFQNILSGVYSSVVLSADDTSLTNVYFFCRQACSQDPCCDGFILSQMILDGGTFLCGLMGYPDVLLCNINDWEETSTLQRGGACNEVKYDGGKKEYSFTLGGQAFTGNLSLCVHTKTQVWKDNSLANVQHESYTCKTKLLWLLGCTQEDTLCQLVDIQNTTTGNYFACTLYPEVQTCDNSLSSIVGNCNTVLPQKPQLLYQKRVVLEGSVKSFYTRVPFRKLTGLSVRNKIDMTGKAVSNGFFECERHCDADPCCTGFGLLNISQATGGKVLCLTLNSLGIQSCGEDQRSAWQVSDCSSPDAELRIYPFGWYQKPANMKRDMPGVCPPVLSPGRLENGKCLNWQLLDGSSVLVDSTLFNFDIVQVSRGLASDFPSARDFCLSVCAKNLSCIVTTLEIQPSVIRCLFYPDTQSCVHGLQGRYCRLFLKEPATYVYRRQDSFLPISEPPVSPSVYIPSHGVLLGTSQVILVGSDWKNISQFFGVPYAAPPVAENRFRPPEKFTWLESWNATAARASCWQPGDGEDQAACVSEDCLYLNVFVPENIGRNGAVLLFFHNGMSGDGDRAPVALDGSYLAAVGDIIVVIASYRVGVFGFLSTGSSAASGNWGLLDQVAALKWVQENVASFGGDPRQITIAGDRSGADVASLHLLARAVEMNLFKRALLMGGSAFSPVSVISKKKAQEQVAVLASEFGCPNSTSEETLSCLRQLPASRLNEAQTRLLAISGPFQYWGPVVDEFYLRESPSTALQRSQPGKVDLLIGSAQQDGLISRAKAVKRFEESQGRVNSKTAFYQALQNSLGGEDSNTLVEDAATWYYSLQHSTADYASFSRALENATRDHFITCPIISMARRWATSSRGNVFMYHVPESSSKSSSILEPLPDVQYAFGLPFHLWHEEQFTLEEKSLSLTVMQYVANFVKSGNPNYPHGFSRKLPGTLSPWPMFLPHTDGESYKEFTISLENHKGLKKADCSFWSDYIKMLKVSTSKYLLISCSL
uniref:Thyroglobulin n=1 Tax=Sphenodon punctatus TaxID=8508 RepID=A0A8D0GVF9_SPHPU